MLTHGDTSYTWTQGRKLASVVKNGVTSKYLYDHTGMRVSKTVDGVETRYRYAGRLLLSEKATGGNALFFCYDSASNLISMTYNSNVYIYVKNLQGDIIGLVDTAGEMVVGYKYDAWGKVLEISGSLASTVGKKNPFRYRGYYYDSETEMYYLQSRYYDPEVKRFINADDVGVLFVQQDSLLQYNQYAYCLNDPVSRVDESGCLSIPNWAKVTIGAVSTVAAVVLTVATGGAVLPVLAGVAVSTGVSAIFGYVSDGKQGAIDGASTGFMLGGVTAAVSSTVGAIRTVNEYKKTIDTYSSLRKQYQGSGMEAHHIIEKRLVRDSKWEASQMPSIELSKSVHRQFTNEWRKEVAYGTKFSPKISYRLKLYKASNKVYSGSRVLKMAARYTIIKM